MRTTTIAMEQTREKIVKIAADDHRLVMVPLLKSFMRVCVSFSVLCFFFFFFFLKVFHIVTFLPVYDLMFRHTIPLL